MSPDRDSGLSDLGDSDDDFQGLDSDQGFLDGLDSDQGMIHGLEDSTLGSPSLPDLSSATRPPLRAGWDSDSDSGEITPLSVDSGSGEIIPLRVDSSGGRPPLAGGDSSQARSPLEPGTVAPGYAEQTAAPGYVGYGVQPDKTTRPPGYVARSKQDTDLGFVEEDLPPDPRARDPFASTRETRAPLAGGADTVRGWGDPDGQPAPSQASQIERRLMQTLELSPEEVSAAMGGGGARDSWDDYVLSAFESHGDTPIILPPPSDMGPIFGTDSESIFDVVMPLPQDAPPLGAPPADRSMRQVERSAQGVVSDLGQVSDMGFVGGMGAGQTAPTTAGRLAGMWKGDTLWILLSLCFALAGPVLILAAWDYYGSSAREGHPWDHQLRPSGSMGLWFGITGSLLFLLNLSYVLRRRLRLLAKWVSLRSWLNLHFVFGLAGGSMILVHSALLTDNLVARVSSAAIFVAIASGIFGRFVLSHVPRREGGEGAARLELAVYLAQLRGDLRRKLTGQPRLRQLALTALAETAPPEEQKARGLAVIPALFLNDLRAARQQRRFSTQLRQALTKEAGDPELEGLIEETIEMVHLHGRLGQRLTQFEAVQDLMDTWRALHMILALIMVVTMILHVLIVLQYNRSAIWGS